MKKLRAKNIILKVGAALLSFGIMFGSLTFVTAIEVSATEPTVSVSGSEETTTYSSPQYVLGKVFMGTQALTDPVSKTYKNGDVNGTYYEPTAYVYFGSYYDSANKRDVSLVHRVLDADADNTGESGAMFVLSEFATLNTQFALYTEDTRDYYKNENVYTQNRLALNYCINRFATSNYTTSKYKKYYNNILEELDYIRGITKNDVKSEMQGLFGFENGTSTYVWDIRDSNGDSVNSAEYLSQTKFFPLSAKELNDYVSTVPYAPGVAVKLVNGNTYVGYWLRTGLTSAYEEENGDTVGGVDENGLVTTVDVYDSDMYVRYGFSIETGDIAFTQMIADKTHRLAFTEPLYKDNTETPFKAELIDIKNGVVTFKYSNAIRNSSYIIYSSVTDKNYISVMIKDKDSGEIKHYGSIADVDSSSDGSPAAISSKESTASFKLPEEYEDGDEVLVFWERKTDRVGAISHVSNMVSLGCIHTPASKATCKKQAECSKCGKAYGSLDYDNHANVDKLVFGCDKDHGIHWNECGDCGARVNITTCTVGSVCTQPCICGNDSFDNNCHSFDQRGVCEFISSHFEAPEVVIRASNATGTVSIENEGQLIGFAKLYNSGAFTDENGEQYSISLTITKDLDFSGIKGYEPIGNTEFPFVGKLNGGGYSVKGIECRSDSENIGIFGVVNTLSVTDWNISDCCFEGAGNVGVLVGCTAENTGAICRYSYLNITDCTVIGTNKGIIAGKSRVGDTVSNVYTYNVKDSAHNNIRFASNPDGMVIGKSACLWNEEHLNYGEYTEEQYASGEIAHMFDMRQRIGVDPAPSNDDSKPVVCKVSYCDRETAYYQSESDPDNSRRYRTIHNPDKFYKFVWEGSFCQASVHCSACGEDVLVTADVDEDLSYVPVRGIYTASITVGDKTYTEIKEIVGIKIEDMIGMTYVKKDFDGSYVYPEELMNNHRLVTEPPASKEYEVYFVDPETGKKYTETSYDYYGKPYEAAVGVCAAGVYDLLVVGKNDYEGQSYTYKGALVIESVTVNVKVNDVYKYYDGNLKFEADYTLDNVKYQQGIEVIYSDAGSSEIGDYVLNVRLNVIDDVYGSSVEYVLTSNTVMGYILPKFKVTVENKSYPTKFTYGDKIPEPDAKYFNFTDGSELGFEWFSAELLKYSVEVAQNQFEERYEALSMSRIYETPQNAGDYILRVNASHSDNLVGNYIELYVEIKPKQLSLELIVPDGAELVEKDGQAYYCLDMGEKPIPNVKGLVAGETLESAGIEVSIMQRDAVYGGNHLPTVNDSYSFPTQPNMYNYIVAYYVSCSNSNYEGTNDSIYVCINGAEAPTPVANDKYVEDDNEKEVGVVFSWNEPNGQYDDITYKITVKLAGNQVGYYERDYDNFYSNSFSLTVPVSKAGDYTAIVEAWSDGKTVDTQTVQFGVSFMKNGNMVDTVKDMGEYTVTVTSDGETAKSLEFVVKREIVMQLKEMDYFISDGTLTYDKTKIVMEAGKVILLGHELVSVNAHVYTNNGNSYIDSITVKDSNGNDVSYLYTVAATAYKDHNNSLNRLSIVHIYDSRCDTECNVYGCEHTRAAAHTGGVATCTSLAVCENCNAEYGSYDFYNHTSEHTHIVPNPDDLMTHLVVYSCCGSTKEIKAHTPATAATCTDRAVCAECGWRYGDIDSSNHTSEEFTYSVSAEDSAVHIKTRICCGESVSESHSGGEATCNTLARCQFCSAEYGERNSDKHEAIIVYNPDSDNASIHSAYCSACDTSWTESHIGGIATCMSAAICDSCNTAYGELDAQNHESEEVKYVLRAENSTMHDVLHSCCGAFIGKAYHSGGEANCTSAALCEFCGEQYGEKDPSNHTSDEYKYVQSSLNANCHIKYHKCCDAEIATEEHCVGNEATCRRANICAECGLKYGERLEHIYDNDCASECNMCGQLTRPYVFHKDVDGNGKCDACGVDIVADIGSSIDGGCSASSSGGAVFVVLTVISVAWFSKKRKETK